MKLLTFGGAFVILIILAAVAFNFSKDNQKAPQELVSVYEQVEKISPKPSPSILYKTIDDYLNYEIPDNWKKKITDQIIEDTRVVELQSPNFRYNSAEGKDDGLKIMMVRQEFTGNTTLKDKLTAEGNTYIDKKDFKVTAITVDGVQGYYFPSANDGMGSDPSFPHLAILNDGYQFNFLFYGASGAGQRQSVDKFIRSLNFK